MKYPKYTDNLEDTMAVLWLKLKITVISFSFDIP